jgi:transposase InsO family protein
VEWVLQRLKDEGYFANPDKCEFFQDSLSFLGHVISKDGLAVQDYKVKAVTAWPTPKSQKEVRAFLGLTGYYRNFIKDYARIAAPLSDLTAAKYAKEIVWGDQQQLAFDKLKQMLVSSPVLVHPDPQLQYVLHTDASDFAVSGVLSQDHGQGLQPIAFWSRKMQSAEWAYPVHEKELLAIVEAVDHWKWYVDGSPHPIIVYTDHRSIEHFNRQPNLSGRQARWQERLSDITFDPRYIKGKNNSAADSLSRRADLYTEYKKERAEVGSPVEERQASDPLSTVESDSKTSYKHIRVIGEVSPAAVVSSAQHVAVALDRASSVWQVTIDSLPLVEMLKKAAAEDEIYQADIAQAARIGLYVSDGLLWTNEGKCHIPDNREVKTALIRLAHDAPTAGHPGRRKTLSNLRAICWWNNMEAEVADYVRGCITCSAKNHSNQRPAGLLRPIAIPHRPWECIHIDFVGPLPMTKNYHNMILTVIDRWTKRGHFIATTVNVTAAKTAKLLLDNVVKLHGVPEKIVSDRGPQFASKLWKELWNRLQTEVRLTTGYHPQANGQAERLNKVLVDGLRTHVNLNRNDWDEWLSLVEYAYNSSVNETTGFTPFEMDGQHVPSLLQLALGMRRQQHEVKGVQEMLDSMTGVWETARKRFAMQQERQKKYHDMKRRDEKYNVGDRVMLDTSKMELSRHQGKLHDRFIGPFTVIEVVSDVNIKLNLPPIYSKIHPTVHIEKVKRYIPSSLEWPGRIQEDRPLPVLVEGEEEYEIEELLGKREVEEKIPIQEEEKKEIVADEGDLTIGVRRSARLQARPSHTSPLTRPPPRPSKPPHQRTRRVVQYLCKWKGYGEEEASWKAEDELQHARDLVDDYELRQADARGEEVAAIQYSFVSTGDPVNGYAEVDTIVI